MSSPYRIPCRDENTRNRRDCGVDVDLLPAAALFWIVSVIRVAGGIVRHETFAAEATLALIIVVAIPWLAFFGRPSKKN